MRPAGRLGATARQFVAAGGAHGALLIDAAPPVPRVVDAAGNTHGLAPGPLPAGARDAAGAARAGGLAVSLPFADRGGAARAVLVMRGVPGSADVVAVPLAADIAGTVAALGDRGGVTLDGRPLAGAAAPAGWEAVRLSAGGRTWTVAVDPSPPGPWAPWGITAAGVALAAWVGSGPWRGRRRGRRHRRAAGLGTPETITPDRDRSLAIVQALQDGLLVIDADGVVREANRRVSEITGVPRAELVGRRLPLPFWPPGATKAAVASDAFARALAGDGAGHEAEFARRTGGRLWLALSSAPLHDGDGSASGRVVMLKDVTAPRVAELERRARDNTDPLTGIANHSVFQERLRDEAAAAAEHGTALSLALFDVDHLKRINQLHGHRAGDEVLREASRRVMACARPGDLFARVGGEKFALLMPGAGPAPALAVAERIRQAIAGLPMPRRVR